MTELGIFGNADPTPRKPDIEAEHLNLSGPAKLCAEYIDDSQLFRDYVERLTNGRDMHAIVTASSETGVGKTTLAVSLALLWDQHGWTAEKAAVADAKRYSYLYDDVPPGSVLILDEAEKAANSRRSMSHANVDVADAFAAKRYLQVFGLLTAPSKSWVDKRLGESAADYWIQALEADGGGIKGEAKVYRLKEQEHYETFYTERTETISWPILDDNEAFQNLDERKDAKLSGSIQSDYVHRDEVEDIKDNYWQKSRKRMRYDMLEAMDSFDVTKADMARILQAGEATESLTQQRVGQIVNADSFDDVYST